MGWKVTNKNAIVNQKENKVIDTVFFFETKEEALEYIEVNKKYSEFSKEKDECQNILEEMTEEDGRFGFYEPGDMRIPHKMIIKPIDINPDEPYWVETKELVWPSVTGDDV